MQVKKKMKWEMKNYAHVHNVPIQSALRSKSSSQLEWSPSFFSIVHTLNIIIYN